MATTKAKGVKGGEGIGRAGAGEAGELRVVEASGRGLVVSAKAVHAALGVGRVFSSWLNERVKRYGFAIGQDYWSVDGEGFSPERVFIPSESHGKGVAAGVSAASECSRVVEVAEFAPVSARTPGVEADLTPERGKSSDATVRGRGRPEQDYWLSLDMAKELAMLDRSEAGRRARKYFLQCERELRQAQEELVRLGRQAQLIENLKPKQYQLEEADRQVFESIKGLRASKPLLLAAMEDDIDTLVLPRVIAEVLQDLGYDEEQIRGMDLERYASLHVIWKYAGLLLLRESDVAERVQTKNMSKRYVKAVLEELGTLSIGRMAARNELPLGKKLREFGSSR